jgi:hypothetical protein
VDPVVRLRTLGVFGYGMASAFALKAGTDALVLLLGWPDGVGAALDLLLLAVMFLGATLALVSRS